MGVSLAYFCPSKHCWLSWSNIDWSQHVTLSNTFPQLLWARICIFPLIQFLMAVLKLMIGYQIQLWVYFGYSSSLTQTQMCCYMSEEFVKRCVCCTSINALIKNVWIKIFVEIPQPGIIQVVELNHKSDKPQKMFLLCDFFGWIYAAGKLWDIGMYIYIYEFGTTSFTSPLFKIAIL